MSIRVIYRPKYKGPINMDYRERGYPCTGCVSPTQETSRMRSARVKQEEEADTKLIA